MKYAVHFTAGNRRLIEEVYADSLRQAQQIILARNPHAKNLTVTGSRSQ